MNDDKIKEAKAKLACHIEPPKDAVSSCGTAAPVQGEKIRLTEMTSAGG